MVFWQPSGNLCAYSWIQQGSLRPDFLKILFACSSIHCLRVFRRFELSGPRLSRDARERGMMRFTVGSLERIRSHHAFRRGGIREPVPPAETPAVDPARSDIP